METLKSNEKSQSPLNSFISIFRITTPEINLEYDVEQNMLWKFIEPLPVFGIISEDCICSEAVKCGSWNNEEAINIGHCP